MNIGEKLKHLREFYGYNQTELARILGTSQRNISNYESSVDTTGLLSYIFKLCNYLKIPVSEFFIDNAEDLKKTLPYFIKPEDVMLMNIINTEMDEETQAEIKKAFKQITKIVLMNKPGKLKNIPAYKELFGEPD